MGPCTASRAVVHQFEDVRGHPDTGRSDGLQHVVGVASKPAFRDAWTRAQHCIIPAEAFWEPGWRSGKCAWTRIGRPDGAPLGIAGLWSWWRPAGSQEDVHSFTMVTINADDHPFMRNYHRAGDEKRMIVILSPEDYDAWLDAPSDRSMDFMRQCPPEHLVPVA
jgi:putative SOS response-associated peptidase YedK